MFVMGSNSKVEKMSEFAEKHELLSKNYDNF